ncbi:hypothetical protein NPIL_367171 [Nephila pilipes]|uniref:Uncharacterized protein n=1 Tax=Nephila pilipes TaxID=299642 RepID=A0A8X6MT09_NEPPI|nr:hypothetical protein NPIL_367171 [Nephila pilipes]
MIDEKRGQGDTSLSLWCNLASVQLFLLCFEICLHPPGIKNAVRLMGNTLTFAELGHLRSLSRRSELKAPRTVKHSYIMGSNLPTMSKVTV